MAVWQFVIDFVPEQFLFDTYGHIPDTMLLEHRKQGNFFQNNSFKMDDFQPYLQAFGILEKNSWSSRSKWYQDEADNDACVYFNEETGLVEDMQCRIDARQPLEHFIYGIITLANAFDCQLLARGTRQLFKPTISELLKAMQQSNACRFSADPLKFLDGFSKGNPSGY